MNRLNQLNSFGHINGAGLSSSNWTPRNITVTVIEGGIRITWTPNATSETEIRVKIDSGVLTLVTTAGLNIGTYDYMCSSEHEYEFDLRFKRDRTVLNAPLTLAAAIIATGYRLTWIDNNTEAERFLLYASINNAGYVLLATINPGIQTYDHEISVYDTIDYKIVASEGTLPVLSAYSNVVSVANPFPAVLSDGNTAGLYEFDALTTITKDGSDLVSSWADKLLSGHDLVQSDAATKPTWESDGILFPKTGSKQKLQTATFIWGRPAYLYMVVKVLNWAVNDVILSAYNSTVCMVAEKDTTPQLEAYGNLSYSAAISPPLNQFFILRVSFDGASSIIQFNNEAPVTWTAHATQSIMSGLSIGGRGTADTYNSNIKVQAVIGRETIPSSGDNTLMYNYLAIKYGLPTI